MLAPWRVFTIGSSKTTRASHWDHDKHRKTVKPRWDEFLQWSWCVAHHTLLVTEKQRHGKSAIGYPKSHPKCWNWHHFLLFFYQKNDNPFGGYYFWFWMNLVGYPGRRIWKPKSSSCLEYPFPEFQFFEKLGIEKTSMIILHKSAKATTLPPWLLISIHVYSTNDLKKKGSLLVHVQDGKASPSAVGGKTCCQYTWHSKKRTTQRPNCYCWFWTSKSDYLCFIQP